MNARATVPMRAPSVTGYGGGGGGMPDGACRRICRKTVKIDPSPAAVTDGALIGTYPYIQY